MPRAIRIQAHGGPEQLECAELAVPEPGPGEARLRQAACGVNFIDCYHRSGLYPLPQLPHGIGVEACGVVEAVGPGVRDVVEGDRVAYAAPPPGAYAEARVVPADRLIPVPDEISDAVAGGTTLRGLTAWLLLHRAFRVRRGHTLLVHAAAGGVGQILCQWADYLGATVIGTVGDSDKAQVAAEHGCHHPVVYTRDDFREKVEAITGGRGVDVAYDSVGAATFEASLDCLRPRGLMVSYGNASGAPPAIEPGLLGRKGSLFLTRPVLFDYVADRQDLLEGAAAYYDAVTQGVVEPRVGRSYPLEGAAQAHRDLEARATTGASVLELGRG
ncbi:MAG: quinone oxidoreductase family protein [Halorhodospira sp.]